MLNPINRYHDNVYIKTGYRKIQFNYAACVRSLFYLHNETGNIYTHLIGAVLFVGLFPLSFIPSSRLLPLLETTTAMDVAVVAIFLASAVVCLGLSTTFHLCCCHSMAVSKAWNKLDYMGIVVLIVGSCVPAVYYGFYCDRTLQISYLIAMAILGSITLFITVSQKYGTPPYRVLRTSVFMALGLSGIIPLTHSVILHGLRFSQQAMSFNWMVAMGSMYVVGALIYGYRVPEKWFPGMFDIWGHSHQIFHVLVVTAAITHYVGVCYSYVFWHENNHNCAISVADMVSNKTLFG
ncbi:hypothetical protein HK101_006023 [Irineochytrium annulatum]|nr:hypothetical protein HK101_006023 [Irineochytrium annulatum]